MFSPCVKRKDEIQIVREEYSSECLESYKKLRSSMEEITKEYMETFNEGN